MSGDERRGRQGRRFISAERRRELLAAFEGSGLPRTALARREGINYPTLCNWVQREGKTGGHATAPAPVRFAEVALPPASAASGARSLATCITAKAGSTTTSSKTRSGPPASAKMYRLFIGHLDAGQRSAILYSLIVSCQRHGKNPLAYLKDLLTRLPRMTSRDDLRLLTPQHWQSATS